MVVIISYHGDSSTVNVMRWLRRFSVPHLRINFSDLLGKKIPTTIRITAKGTQLYVNGYELNRHSVIWLRKLDGFSAVEGAELIKKELGGVYAHINKEYTAFIKSLMHVLRDAEWLCPIHAKDLNKVEVISKAQACGLAVPETTITNSRQSLTEHLQKNPNSITKTLADALSISIAGSTPYLLSTTPLADNHLAAIPLYFVPSIVQGYVEKEVELRIFYLDGKFFTSAIFSQNQEHTKIDFRITPEGTKPCRIVPFVLPRVIENKLDKLMRLLGLNTGSIDMIYTKNKEYVFLEVNPAGQYGWVGASCSYEIDRYIAHYLKQKHDERAAKENNS